VSALARGSASPSLEGFLAALAEGTPTPGGGAAVALTVAIAAALVGMVARVTLRKGADATVESLADSADRRRAEALAGVGEDADAYAAVVRARRAGSPEAFAAALVRATDAPLAVARVAHDVLALAATLAPVARRSARSDLAVGADLAAGALDGAARTVRANLGELGDRPYVTRVGDEITKLLADADALRRRATGTEPS